VYLQCHQAVQSAWHRCGGASDWAGQVPAGLRRQRQRRPRSASLRQPRRQPCRQPRRQPQHQQHPRLRACSRQVRDGPPAWACGQRSLGGDRHPPLTLAPPPPLPPPPAHLQGRQVLIPLQEEARLQVALLGALVVMVVVVAAPGAPAADDNGQLARPGGPQVVDPRLRQAARARACQYQAVQLLAGRQGG